MSEEKNNEYIVIGDVDENHNKLLYIVGLVNHLSANRAFGNKWLEVGNCLFNINNNVDFLKLWIDFSKKHNPQYIEGDCEKKWSSFENKETATLDTLCYFVYKDNRTAYEQLNITYKNGGIEKVIESCSHYDIAQVLYESYRFDFVCANISKHEWYQYKGHRWVEMDKGTALRSKISTDIYKRLVPFYEKYKASVVDCSEDHENINKEILKKLKKLMTDVKNSKFKDNVMIECCHIFYDETFLDKLDNNVNLIGFENGIYDLQSGMFRHGRPYDYITLSTKTNYKKFNDKNRNVINIRKFLEKLQPDIVLREYLLLSLASFLQGKNKEESFDIWIGCGSNGKSKLLELLQLSFGEYCTTIPISALTQKNGASNAATPEIAQAKGRRIVSMSETGPEDKLNVGKMKEYTGNDTLYVRELYKSPTKFIPQWSLLMLCNHLPIINSTDKGTWRRIRALEFQSEFVDNPDPNKKNQFKKDCKLSENFIKWKEYFASLLLECYKTYIKNGITLPDEVIKYTKEYQNTQDFYSEFIEEKVESEQDSYIRLQVLWSEFKEWFVANRPSDKMPKRKNLKEYMENKYGKMKSKGWKGLKIKCEDEIEEEEENDLDFGF